MTMKWKSSNLYLPFTIIPLLWVAVLLTIGIFGLTSWPSLLAYVVVFISSIVIIRHSLHQPYPLKTYHDMEKIDFALPEDFKDVPIYSSKAMAQYSFLVRTAEVLSPPLLHNKPPKVVLNPVTREQKGETFMRIFVVRELIKFRLHVNIMNILTLFIPLLAMLCSVLAVVYFKIPMPWNANAPVSQFVLPVLTSSTFIVTSIVWNKMIGIREKNIDQLLLAYFPAKDVIHFISTTEQMHGEHENPKHRFVNQHYAEERISAISRSTN